MSSSQRTSEKLCPHGVAGECLWCRILSACDHDGAYRIRKCDKCGQLMGAEQPSSKPPSDQCVVPERIATWIRGMVKGTEHRNIGHMMGTWEENFRTQPFEEGLSLIRTGGPVQGWLSEADGDEIKRRMHAVRDYVADEVRKSVIEMFEGAQYHGD